MSSVRRRIPLGTGIALVVLAATFAGSAGWSWWQAAHDESLDYARTRTVVLNTGRDQVATLSSIDYRQVDQGIAQWLAVSTGALREQLGRTDENTKNSLKKGGTVAAGKVLDAAVADLDTKDGVAKLLASVEIGIARSGAAPTTERNRFEVGLTRTETGWKVSALDQIPVGAG